MEQFKSFVSEARELSSKLPAEQNELYKRYIVSLPIEEFSTVLESAVESPDEEKALVEYARRLQENFGVTFDVVVGSTRTIVNSNVAKVLDVSGLTEEHFQKKMHKSKDDRLVAFIHANSKKIILIDVPSEKKERVRILFANGKVPLVSQVAVKTGKNSSLELFEWCGTLDNNAAASLSGILHEFDIGANSRVEANIVRNEDAKTYTAGLSKGRVDESGELRVNYFYNGGISSRVKNEFIADGYAADVKITEIVIGSSEQKFDIGTVVMNSVRDTVTDLESKAALMDKSMCLLKGFANIQETAPGAKSFVNERGIVLDKSAHIDSIPGMSINNRNVKASHSSATAPIEEDSLFYLMSRGTSEANAKKLLIAGFFASSISKIRDPVVKEIVSSLVQEKVDNRKFGNIPKATMTNMWGITDAGTAMFKGNYKMKSE